MASRVKTDTENTFQLEQFEEGVDNKKFDLGEFVLAHKNEIAFLLLGVILLGSGVFLTKRLSIGVPSKIEVLESSDDVQNQGKEIFVEIAGAVEAPGVYKLSGDSRVEDLLIAAGGFSAGADRTWIEKYINRAAKLADGQKVYIQAVNEQSNILSANKKVEDLGNKSEQNEYVNINGASSKELETLPGIGPVYAQSIIEHRPYSFIEELLSREVLKKNVYEKIKDKISVY